MKKMLLCVLVGFITLAASAPTTITNTSSNNNEYSSTMDPSHRSATAHQTDMTDFKTAPNTTEYPTITPAVQLTDSTEIIVNNLLSADDNSMANATETTNSNTTTLTSSTSDLTTKDSSKSTTNDALVSSDSSTFESTTHSGPRNVPTTSYSESTNVTPTYPETSHGKSTASGTSDESTTDTASMNVTTDESTTDSAAMNETTEESTTDSVSTNVTMDESTTDSASTNVTTDESTTDSASSNVTTDGSTSTTISSTISSTHTTTSTTTTEPTTSETTTSETTTPEPTTPEPTTPTATEPPLPNTIGVDIVAGVLGVMLLGGLLATGVVMHRQGKLPWNPRNSNASVRPQPILLSKFETHCKELLDTPARLGSEYQLLLTLSSDIHDTNTVAAAQLPDNKKKNRYVNILPYDLTRVKLDVINEDPSSDYINASFIKGFSNSVEYIASQGPKEETVNDFWRMIHQHDVQLIVMVTNLEEGGKIKCDPYLPKLREQLTSGDIIVRCSTELHFPIHTQRSIVLHKDDIKRSITHLHFNEWPDFGCPEGTDSMLQFCQTIRHTIASSPPGLILVHCSAGVGRTGTLIATDILLQHIQVNKKVDVFGTVFKLRKQRTNMVQTMGQYAYIYKSIRDAILDPSFLKTEESPSNSMEPIYENVPTKLTTFVYEKVPAEVKAKSTSSESECEM